MKKYPREDQRALAAWSLDAAERVLELFERHAPGDPRPRQAIEAGRRWVRTGEFNMREIRSASLGAHAAAKVVKATSVAASHAAHAAGQAVATAHVPQHALGGAYYALRAVVAEYGETAEDRLAAEHSWQSDRLPAQLRDEVMPRLTYHRQGKGFTVSLDKSGDF